MTNPARPMNTAYAPNWKQSAALDIGAYCPRPLTEAIEWLQKTRTLVPEDCQASARLELEDHEIYVVYTRPMTDGELKVYQEQQEQQERKNLAHLIAKYGVPSGS